MGRCLERMEKCLGREVKVSGTWISLVVVSFHDPICVEGAGVTCMNVTVFSFFIQRKFKK